MFYNVNTPVCKLSSESAIITWSFIVYFCTGL